MWKLINDYGLLIKTGSFEDCKAKAQSKWPACMVDGNPEFGATTAYVYADTSDSADVIATIEKAD